MYKTFLSVTLIPTLIATLIAAGLCGCAQASQQAQVSQTVQANAAAPMVRPNPVPGPRTLGGHLVPGTKIFAVSGKWVGMFGGFNADGSLILWQINPDMPQEARMLRAGGHETTRVLPAGSVRWTGHRLIANLTVAAIDRLPAATGAG